METYYLTPTQPLLCPSFSHKKENKTVHLLPMRRPLEADHPKSPSIEIHPSPQCEKTGIEQEKEKPTSHSKAIANQRLHEEAKRKEHKRKYRSRSSGSAFWFTLSYY
jgi:hypothetical protein